MRIRWTRPAARDLTAICDYIGQRDSSKAARRVALRIFEAVDSLAQFPRRGRSGRKPGTRELTFSDIPYLVIYRISEESVEVARILHGAQRRP